MLQQQQHQQQQHLQRITCRREGDTGTTVGTGSCIRVRSRVTTIVGLSWLLLLLQFFSNEPFDSQISSSSGRSSSHRHHHHRSSSRYNNNMVVNSFSFVVTMSPKCPSCSGIFAYSHHRDGVSRILPRQSFLVRHSLLLSQQQQQQQQQQSQALLRLYPNHHRSHHHQMDDTNDPTTVSTTTNDNRHRNRNSNIIHTYFRNGVVQMIFLILSSNLFFLTVPIENAVAASYGSLSPEQKVVAEAWRLVDNSFLDRTFNHQDWFALRQKYVVQSKYKNMEDAQTAIAEMVQTLGDKYTRYLTPSQYQSLVDSATGVLSNGGVGIEITKNIPTNQIYASDIQENSPAAKAGIQINDIFVQVDGQEITERMTPDDVALLLRGPLQSKVGIVMQNHITHQNVDYLLQRQPITITAVQSYLSTYNNNNGGSSSNSNNKKVGVIRIKNFSSTTATVVQTALQELQKKGNPISYYLFDLRGNPGGLLPGGVDTASLFLSDNIPVVYVVNKSGITDTQSTLVTGYDTTTPITILVDHNTASAAEVFTAALQENHRAVVIGEQTFGKGIVQTIRELSDHNGGIAITVARYETPLHHDINQQGITVNIPTPVDCPKNNAILCLPTNNPTSKAIIFQPPPV